MIPFKILTVLSVAIAFFASLYLLILSCCVLKKEIPHNGFLLKNQHASLLLEKNPKKSSEFLAYLQVTTRQCTGSLARKTDDATPAKAFFRTGDFENGLLEIYQPPTMGEAACKITLELQKNSVTKAAQTEGDCDAWHGKTCAFDTIVLGGMRLLGQKTPLDRADLNS